MDGSPVDPRPPRPGVAAGPSVDRALAEGWAVDLHTHSRHSDGVWTPRELVEEAGRRGVRVLALTEEGISERERRQLSVRAAALLSPDLSAAA